jgi:hypothetical protein
MRTLSFLATALLLASCTHPPAIQGEFTNEAGRLRVHPNGRLEIIVEPRSAK